MDTYRKSGDFEPIVHLQETATDKVANMMSTVGSTGSDLNGYAVANACKILKERLKPYREKGDATINEVKG